MILVVVLQLLLCIDSIVKLLPGCRLTIENLLTCRVDYLGLRATHFLRWDPDHGLLGGLVIFLGRLHTIHQIVDVDGRIRWDRLRRLG